jgi:hypothetical protein
MINFFKEKPPVIVKFLDGKYGYRKGSKPSNYRFLWSCGVEFWVSDNESMYIKFDNKEQVLARVDEISKDKVNALDFGDPIK